MAEGQLTAVNLVIMAAKIYRLKAQKEDQSRVIDVRRPETCE